MVDYTLTADPLALSATARTTAAAGYADTLALSLSFPAAALFRGYETDIGSLVLRLDRIRRQEALTEADRTASQRFQLIWQRHCEAIESAFSRLASSVAAIQAAYDAAAQASASASEAQAAVVEAQAVATEVSQSITDLTSGDIAFTLINVGGTRFDVDDLM